MSDECFICTLHTCTLFYTILYNILYRTDVELFHMLKPTAGVPLQLCLYACDFAMSGCLCSHSATENCYCVPLHCLHLPLNNTNKIQCAPSPSLAPFSRHEHCSPLGNRCCTHSLTEISRRKQA